MLASFVAFKRSPDEILLVCSRDLLPGALKRLSMFVLRSKAKLSDASAEVALYGLAGDAVPFARVRAPGRWGSTQEPRRAPVPADGGPRRAVGRRRERDGSGGRGDGSCPVAVGRGAQRHRHAHHAGGGSLRAADAELRIGGRRELQEGLLPGPGSRGAQPVPRHAQRRAFVAHADAELTTGQEVFKASDPEQPAGVVAEAARAPGGGWDAIVSLQLTAAEAGDLHAGTAGGPA